MKNSFLIKMLENCHMHLLMKKTMRIIVAKKQNILERRFFYGKNGDISTRRPYSFKQSTATWEDIRLLCEEAVEVDVNSFGLHSPVLFKTGARSFPATESMYSDRISTGLQHDGEQSL